MVIFLFLELWQIILTYPEKDTEGRPGVLYPSSTGVSTSYVKKSHGKNKSFQNKAL